MALVMAPSDVHRPFVQEVQVTSEAAMTVTIQGGAMTMNQCRADLQHRDQKIHHMVTQMRPCSKNLGGNDRPPTHQDRDPGMTYDNRGDHAAMLLDRVTSHRRI